MVATINRQISNKKANKTGTEENVFRFPENEYPELSQQDGAFYHIRRTKAKIGKGTNAVTWNKNIYNHDMKRDRKRFSVKGEL